MKKSGNHITRYLAWVMLLIFAAAIMPLDFFHSHPPECGSCKTEIRKGETCGHKFHIGKKSRSCWACAAHFDKSFITCSFSEKAPLFPAVALLAENRVTAYFTELIFTFLRGPPGE